jgi:hypothetical protein
MQKRTKASVRSTTKNFPTLTLIMPLVKPKTLANRACDEGAALLEEERPAGQLRL